VLELSGADLITTAVLLGADETVRAASEFCVGTAATVFAPKAGWTPRALLERVDAGVAFIQTQLCFNLNALRRYMEHLVAARLTWRCAVIASLAVLPDAASARRLREQVHGAAMPAKLVQRIAQAADPEREGIRVCAERIQRLREIPGISGVNLMTPGPAELIAETVRAAGLRTGQPV
jgi:methylenetetrahydrofolate reductase (NADPH)